MPAELKPMRWPRPAPLLWWVGDYSDIRERIRRDRRLDTIDDVWVAHSDDSYNAFCGRHGTSFAGAFREQTATDYRSRYAEQVSRLQEEWEAERRERQRAKQAAADREWQAIEESRAFWAKIDPAYGRQKFRHVNISRGGQIMGVSFEVGGAYWVPQTIADMLTGSS